MTFNEPKRFIVTNKGIQYKAPVHRASVMKVTSTTLSNPIIPKKDFDYFIKKFGVTVRTDRRMKIRGKVKRTNVPKTQIIINTDNDYVKWHEIGHLVAEDIVTQEFKTDGEMILSNLLRTLQIRDDELKMIKELSGDNNIYDDIDKFFSDMHKIKNNLPPYDKIPQSEVPRILKDYENNLKILKNNIEYSKKPTEIFADFFSIYQLQPNVVKSKLPRLYALYGNIIDNYMEKA